MTQIQRGNIRESNENGAQIARVVLPGKHLKGLSMGPLGPNKVGPI